MRKRSWPVAPTLTVQYTITTGSSVSSSTVCILPAGVHHRLDVFRRPPGLILQQQRPRTRARARPGMPLRIPSAPAAARPGRSRAPEKVHHRIGAEEPRAANRDARHIVDLLDLRAAFRRALAAVAR